MGIRTTVRKLRPESQIATREAARRGEGSSGRHHCLFQELAGRSYFFSLRYKVARLTPKAAAEMLPMDLPRRSCRECLSWGIQALHKNLLEYPAQKVVPHFQIFSSHQPCPLSLALPRGGRGPAIRASSVAVTSPPPRRGEGTSHQGVLRSRHQPSSAEEGGDPDWGISPSLLVGEGRGEGETGAARPNVQSVQGIREPVFSNWDTTEIAAALKMW